MADANEVVRSQRLQLALVAATWGARIGVGAIALWAIAAGTWRALRTASTPLPAEPWVYFGGAVLFAAGAAAIAALILLASALFGGILGFLFGLPRQTPPSAGGGSGASGTGQKGESNTRAPAEYAMSPALIEIADWLTKIIVGIGLVQFELIRNTFNAVVALFLGAGGVGKFPGGGVVVPTLMMIGLIGGFIAAYLATALALGRELADVALDLFDLKRQRDAAEQRAEKAQQTADLQEAILRLRGFNIARFMASTNPNTDGSTTDQDRSDAILVSRQTLADMTGIDQIRAWSKAQAILNKTSEAVEGYHKLEGMLEKQPRDVQEALLVEAELVNRKAGRTVEANELQRRADVLGQTHRVNMTLKQTGLPGVLYEHFATDDARLAAMRNIIKVVSELNDSEQASFMTDGKLPLWYACALGQAHAILVKRGLGQDSEAQGYVRNAVDALTRAVAVADNRPFAQLLMNPNDPRKVNQPASEREDDLESFYSVPEVKKVVFP